MVAKKRGNARKPPKSHDFGGAKPDYLFWLHYMVAEMGFEPHDLRVIAPRPSSSRVVLRVRQAALPKLALGKTPLAKTPCPWRFGFANPTSLARRSHNPTKEKTAQWAVSLLFGCGDGI